MHEGKPRFGFALLRAAVLLLALVWAEALLAARPPVFATPDQVELVRAARALQDGFESDAHKKFLRAAGYGNKLAQKNLGLMYIKGLGVEKDWARAYAWFRLAASHNDYAVTAARDEIFGALRDDEKARAEIYFKEIKAEYGDAQALRRRELWVRRQKREVTGSRLGTVGALRVRVSDATGYTWDLSGDQYFDVLDTFVMDLRVHIGEVEFGELEVLEDDPEPSGLQKPDEEEQTATADPD
jgi:hypothetical protein